jgi:hypothetical protein
MTKRRFHKVTTSNGAVEFLLAMKKFAELHGDIDDSIKDKRK